MPQLSVVGVIRPNFLVLTPACISLGLASALYSGEPVQWPLLAVILLAALLAHVSVNALNEYGDFRSGLDLHTRRTPFSGGSGTLPQHPQLAPQALGIALLALAGLLACGLFLVWRAGWGLVPLGLAGLAVILLYTGPINRNRYLVLIAPGLGFGPLMVLGTEYALTSQFSMLGLVASLLPFFLVNNLLFLNQYPDIGPDRDAGRDNFVIALEPRSSALIYGGFALAAYLSILLATLAGLYPDFALLGLLTLFPAYRVFIGARRFSGDVEELLPSLGHNVVVTLSTPLLVAVGMGLDILIGQG